MPRPSLGPTIPLDACSLFEHYIQATNLRPILQIFNQICLSSGIDPTDAPNLYPRLKRVCGACEGAVFKARQLFDLLDKRRSHAEYRGQTICAKMNVLVIGAGPCGLRAAIEAALLGAKVVVIEQREDFSRHNVLHLWEFVIRDLKALGAKIFSPKFCTGSLEHISIRQLQAILVKVALLLGVQIHEGVSFIDILEPTSTKGWRAKFDPADIVLNDFEFDFVIGADGKRNTLAGFPKQVVRGKLAIGITANFVNKKTKAEDKVPEISGVAYIFNQAFFKDMLHETGVDLENIVYYKDDTHYFVMCAKKQSLIAKGVIKADHEDVSQLLARENVDQDMLCKYAMQAADFATNGKLPNLEYKTNHRGQCDVAMFDFTALHSALHSTHFIERRGRPLVVTIVGDTLHEPFWPTGSGCARGFLGVFDAAWMLRSFGLNSDPPAEIVAARENVLKLLTQTTKEKMHKSYNKYTIDPKSRYQNIPRCLDVATIVDTQFDVIDPTWTSTTTDVRLPPWGAARMGSDFDRRHRLQKLCSFALQHYRIRVFNFSTTTWGDGKALLALVSKFRPDLVDYTSMIAASKQSEADHQDIVRYVFEMMEREYALEKPCDPGSAWARLPEEKRFKYIESLVDAFREDPHSNNSIMSPTAKIALSAASRKRSRIRLDASKAKKSDHINQKAGTLMNAMQGTTSVIDGIPFMEKMSRLDDGRPKPVRTNGTVEREPIAIVKGKGLNEDIINYVEDFISGKAQKEHFKAMHDEKVARADAVVHKMPEEKIAAVENVIKETINGNGEKNKEHASFTSLEEKEIDEKLASVNNVLKNSDLTGVDAVTRFREQQQSQSRKIPPPAPPKPIAKPALSSSDDDRENRDATTTPTTNGTGVDNATSVIFRTDHHNNHGYQKQPPPTRRPFSSPVPPVSDVYASVLPRRRNLCATCNVDVYLAEQLPIDRFIIHKRCFKCGYCQIPLRINIAAVDKSLQDVFGIRWYCQQHANLPRSDKVARLERIMQTGRATAIAVVAPTKAKTPTPPLPSQPVEPRSRPPLIAGDKYSPLYDNITPRSRRPPPTSSNTIFSTQKPDSVLTSSSTSSSSSESLGGSMDRPTTRGDGDRDNLTPIRQAAAHARERGIEMSSILSSPGGILTGPGPQQQHPSPPPPAQLSSPKPVPRPRTKFTNAVSAKSSIESTSSNDYDEPTEDEDSDLEFIDVTESESDDEGSSLLDDTEEDEQDEDKWYEFEELLETTLTRNEDGPIKEVTEQQAAKLIDTFNRRSLLLNPNPPAPKTLSKEDFHTPLSETTQKNTQAASSSSSPEFFTPATSRRTPTTDRVVTYFSPSSKKPSQPTIQETPKLTAANNGHGHHHMASAASESQKEAGLLGRRAKMSRARNSDRRATVAIDPDMVKEADEHEKQQKSIIISGPTTKIEIMPNASPAEFHTPTTTDARRNNRRAELLKRRKNRAKTLTDGINAGDLQNALAALAPAIPVSPRNIKRVQRYAEQVLKRRENERHRSAQEVQRGLDETESRIYEVNRVGLELEIQLINRPKVRFTLEQWVIYVQELYQLRLRKEDLNNRVQEITLAEKQRVLHNKLMELDSADGVPSDGNLKLKKDILSQFVAAVEAHQRIRSKIDANVRQTRNTVFNVQSVLRSKNYDFNKFRPVFTTKLPDFEQFLSSPVSS